MLLQSCQKALWSWTLPASRSKMLSWCAKSSCCSHLDGVAACLILARILPVAKLLAPSTYQVPEAEHLLFIICSPTGWHNM